jgi:hypothetical protein
MVSKYAIYVRLEVFQPISVSRVLVRTDSVNWNAP